MTMTHIASPLIPADHQVGIVHIGLGAFHRAHQAVYTEQALQQFGGDWMICSANIRSNATLVEQLQTNDQRFHVVEYASQQSANVREIRAIKEALFAGDDAGRSALLARLVDTHTKIVTMTVTEKAYLLSPATGELQLDHPDIAYDLAHPEAPKTVIGLLTHGLRLRRAAGLSPFTVLCCDNMPDNGKRVRGAVLACAQGIDPELAAWIREQVAFPCSMVDRIVPAMTEADFAQVAQQTGIDHPTTVKCEQFSQWVIEDHFPQGRPQWEAVGVQMVEDVSTYEMMKLRMLNGSHSLLAYLAPLAGYKTVAQAMTDDIITQFLRHYMVREVAATLQTFSSVELSDYCDALVARFKNDSLQHQLQQIAMDGSQKLPQRWLQGWLTLTQQSHDSSATELGIAGWLWHVMSCQRRGLPLNDPLEQPLYDIVTAHQDVVARVRALLECDDIFPVAMATDMALMERLVKRVMQLQALPLQDILADVGNHA